jgi:hypothetical protein
VRSSIPNAEGKRGIFVIPGASIEASKHLRSSLGRDARNAPFFSGVIPAAAAGVGSRDMRFAGKASSKEKRPRNCGRLLLYFCPLLTASCFLSTAYCPLLSAYCLLPPAFCLLPTAYCPLLHGFPVAFFICFFISRAASSTVFSASCSNFFVLSSMSWPSGHAKPGAGDCSGCSPVCASHSCCG